MSSLTSNIVVTHNFCSLTCQRHFFCKCLLSLTVPDFVDVLRHHLVKHSVCSAAIHTRLMTISMDGDTLNLERRQDDDKLFVSGMQIVAKDVVGTNGIIHVIDDIIMPDSGE
jgi:Secreted and surface protein containing fasciclin-like repeats